MVKDLTIVNKLNHFNLTPPLFPYLFSFSFLTPFSFALFSGTASAHSTLMLELAALMKLSSDWLSATTILSDCLYSAHLSWSFSALITSFCYLLISSLFPNASLIRCVSPPSPPSSSEDDETSPSSLILCSRITRL